jgi:hypothetical protein
MARYVKPTSKRLPYKVYRLTKHYGNPDHFIFCALSTMVVVFSVLLGVPVLFFSAWMGLLLLLPALAFFTVMAVYYRTTANVRYGYYLENGYMAYRKITAPMDRQVALDLLKGIYAHSADNDSIHSACAERLELIRQLVPARQESIVDNMDLESAREYIKAKKEYEL